ncbi:hypothetical protein [Labedaea rhizosphaerae]|uniref:hypothetical protein n=1 Tax=Labedaea rhizosphaerae TaxID=598644 RepID=UPI00105CC16D|nr:hypothetical protein [Labedaea rhizosphaerae]
MIEFGSRARKLPAPPAVVWESLVDRSWLALLADETEPTVIAAEKPARVVWSSLWADRATDEIHFDLTPAADGGTLARFTLLTPGEAPDESKTGHLRRRLNQLLFADLRYSYGQ